MEQVDILLATYNGEKYLQEQIESILKQTYSNFRLIISDDCSKDKTKDIIREYAKKDSRIKYYFQDRNLGYVKNFEFLLSTVQSEIYALSDQDDVWMPQKIEKYVEKMKHENADLVFGDLEIVDKDLNLINKSFNDYMNLSVKIEKCNNYEMLYLYNCVTGCTIVSKRKLLEKVLPLPTDSKHICHDYWIALMASIYGKISYIKEPYIKYRQHENNQVGIKKVSKNMKKFNDIRNLFIQVKLDLFKTNVKNNERFPEELQELNNKSLEYFNMVSNKKNFNFKSWNIFRKLYKNETFNYYILNFIIINLPFIGRILFKVRYPK